jgi:hypothetical protein
VLDPETIESRSQQPRNFGADYYRHPLNGDRALDHGDAIAGDDDAVAPVLAPQLAAARRDLTREQRRLAEPGRPIGNQGRMRRAGDRVLGNAGSRREIARHEIGPPVIVARIVTHAQYVTFQMAEVVVPHQLFAEILRLIGGLRPRAAPA